MELFKWYKLKESPNLPVYARSVFYWGVTLTMILASGGLAVLYGVEPRNAIMVLNIGISAPLLIRALAEAGDPTPVVAQNDSEPQLPRAPGYRQDDPDITQFQDKPKTAGLIAFLSWR